MVMSIESDRERERDIGNPWLRNVLNTSGLTQFKNQSPYMGWRCPVKRLIFLCFRRLYFSLKHDLTSSFSSHCQCSAIYSMRLPLVYVVLTFKCHLQVCWGGLLLLHKFDEKLVCPWIQDSCRKGYQCFVLFFYFLFSAFSVKLTPQKKVTSLMFSIASQQEKGKRQKGGLSAPPWLCWARNCFPAIYPWVNSLTPHLLCWRDVTVP